MESSADTSRTRSKNKNQHPGEVQNAGKRKRRTKKEMEEANALKEAEKKGKELKTHEQIKNIAGLEGEIAKKDADAETAHPRSRKDVQMVVSDDNAMDVPKRIRPRPLAKNSQNQGKVPNVADQRDMELNRIQANNEDIQDNDIAMDVEPKLKEIAKVAERPVRPKPAKSSQRQAKVDQRDLTTEKGSKSNNNQPDIENIQDNDTAMDVEPKPKEITKLAERPVYPKLVKSSKAKGPKPASSKSKEVDQRNLTTDEGSKSDHNLANEVRDDEDLTDAYTDPPPTRKKSRTGLVRSYAMAYIPGTPKNESEDGYEPDTEKEVVYSEIEQVAAAAEVYHQENDTEAPKKKKKADKPKVRDLIKAQKDDLAIQQDNMDVCEVEPSTATKTSQTGKIQNWTDQVAKANKKSKVAPSTATSVTSATVVRTTASSSVAIAPTTKKKAKINPGAVNLGVSAILDEDESVERHAALTSPIKGKKRLTAKGMVKEEPSSPLPKRTLGGKKYTNSDLPAGVLDNGIWRQVFIPTYVKYLASQNSNDTWTISDNDAIELMQNIWKFIYGARVPYRIKTRGPVFFLVNQRVCEWHNGFGSGALAILNAFFKEDKNGLDSDDACRDFANSMLDEFTFLFGSVKETKKKVIRKNVFHGPLVVQTFANHLNYIDGAVTVSGGDSELVEPGNGLIALALTAASVERALTFWRDGHVTLDGVGPGGKTCTIRKTIDPNTGKETKATEFNQAKWGGATNGYLNSIKKNIACGKFNWAGFVRAATQFKKPSRHGESTNASSSSAPATGGMDARALIVDDSDDGSDGSGGLGSGGINGGSDGSNNPGHGQPEGGGSDELDDDDDDDE